MYSSDGVQFYISANNVILSPGDKDGVLRPCYFKDIRMNPGKHCIIHFYVGEILSSLDGAYRSVAHIAVYSTLLRLVNIIIVSQHIGRWRTSPAIIHFYFVEILSVVSQYIVRWRTSPAIVHFYVVEILSSLANTSVDGVHRRL